MPALLKPDLAQGPGHGIMEVPGPIQGASQAPPTFALYRASDGQCLSPGGWQSTEFFLTPDAWDADSGALRLAVGPQVVDCMDTLDTYRLIIRAGEKTSHTLLVEDILYSPQHGGGGIVSQPAAAPAAPPVPPPAPEPEPEPELPPVADAGPQSLSMAEAQDQPRRSKTPLLLALLLLLLCAGGGLWWYLQRDAAPPAPVAGQPQGDQAAQPAPENAPAAQPATPQEPPRPPLTLAREHLRAGGDAQKSMELARGMTAPEAADAVFLLVEDAAQKGQAEAMLRLAAFYDPASSAPRGSINPDPEQARAWYAKALAAGRQEAKSALDALRAWAEGAAAKGDKAAAALLQNWNTAY